MTTTAQPQTSSKIKLHKPPAFYRQTFGLLSPAVGVGTVRFERFAAMIQLESLIGTGEKVRFECKRSAYHDINMPIVSIEPEPGTNPFLYRVTFISGKWIYLSIDQTSYWRPVL
jgi:hypothetical protein